MKKSVLFKVGISLVIIIIILLIVFVANDIIDKRIHTVKGKQFTYEDYYFVDGLITNEGYLLVGNGIVHVNKEGEIIWEIQNVGYLKGIIETKPNHYLAYGNHPVFRNYIVEFDGSGEIMFQGYMGSRYNTPEGHRIYDVWLDDNNDLIFLNDNYLFKITSDGTITNIAKLNDFHDELFIDKNGNYLIYQNPDNYDSYGVLSKVSQEGETIWSKRIDKISDMKQDDDGNYIIFTSDLDCVYKLCTASTYESSIQVIDQSGKLVNNYVIGDKIERPTNLFITEDNVVTTFVDDKIYRLENGDLEKFEIKTTESTKIYKVIKQDNDYVLLGNGTIIIIEDW